MTTMRRAADHLFTNRSTSSNNKRISQ